jgi:glyoxylate reductase
LPSAIEAELHGQFAARLIAPVGDRFDELPQGLRVIIATPGCPLRAALIDQLPDSVGLIAAYSVGVDYIDVAAARRRGLAISNTPDVLTNATADIAMLLILAACRNTSWAERHLRTGQWAGVSLLDMFGVDLASRTLGILGFGRIGQATARRAQAFGMQVIYHGPRIRNEAHAIGARFEPDLKSFLHASDVVSLHAPLTPATSRIINRDSLSAMRPGSVLVNTARGDLIEDEAVIDALRTGHLRAAGFDVFAGEPKLHPAYGALENVTLLPHMGSATVETRLAMGRRVIANIEAFLAGRAVPDVIAH